MGKIGIRTTEQSNAAKSREGDRHALGKFIKKIETMKLSLEDI